MILYNFLSKGFVFYLHLLLLYLFDCLVLVFSVRFFWCGYCYLYPPGGWTCFCDLCGLVCDFLACLSLGCLPLPIVSSVT